MRRHFEKILTLLFLVPVAIKGIFNVIYADAFCVDNIFGSRRTSSGNLSLYFMDLCGPLIVSLFFIAFFAINIVCELKRSLDSSREQGVHHERSDRRRATVYILISCAAYIVMFAPMIPCGVLYSLQPDNRTYIAFVYACLTCQAVYGMINVVIFIGMHRHYYKRLWTSIVRCKLLSSNRVQPLT